MELDALTARCDRIREERARVTDRLSQLHSQQLEQAQYDSLGQTLEDFCRKMSGVLDNPSFETKQRILRLVVDKILVSDEEITIQHTVPTSDVRLWRDRHPEHGPCSECGVLIQKNLSHRTHCCGCGFVVHRDQMRPSTSAIWVSKGLSILAGKQGRLKPLAA